MSKYHDLSLKRMAKTVMEAKKKGDMRYLNFIMVMMMNTGLSQKEVEQRIVELAK